MKKIPTLFRRDPDDMRYVLPEVTPGCEWVLAGEGVATRKYDGTCVAPDEAGNWWARREVKPGKTPPPRFVPEETDETTGKTVGWEPIEQSGFIKFFTEARAQLADDPRDGTYELCGPKINGNPEGFDHHRLIRHGRTQVPKILPAAELVCEFCADTGAEGIVWHHPDGRMAKLKGRDFPGAAR